jgi:hypothetical protein
MIPRRLLVCIVLACVSNLIWIHMNAAPPRSWDDAEYLSDSVIAFHALERGDPIEFLRLASRPARGVHPPMTKLLPIPMYMVFGAGTRPALYGFTALIPLFCVYLFLLARTLSKDDSIAVLAVAITCCFPLTFGLWRVAMSEFGLAAAVIAAQYHLFRSGESRSGWRTHALLAGAFIGWGLLWKISLPVFVAGPLCYVLVRRLVVSKHRDRLTVVGALSLVAVTAAAIAGPFYFLRSRALWDFVLNSSSPSTSLEQFALGPVLSPMTVLKYFGLLANSGVSAYFVLLGAAIATVHLTRRRWPLPRPETWFMASCIVVPVAFFSFQYLKEPRHVFPAFAMFGIMIAALLQDVIAQQTTRVRAVVLTGLLAFPLYQFVYLSFDIPYAPSRDVRIGPLVLLFADRESLFVRPANPTAWPVSDVVALMAAHGTDINGRAPRIRVAGHIPFLDGPGLSYESLLRDRNSLTYSMPGDRSLHPTWWDFVIVLTGPMRNHVEYREPLLATLLSEQRLPFAPVGTITLPDGRAAVVYRRAPGAAAIAASGEDLLTAVDRRGAPLYPVNRATWRLPDGSRSVAVARHAAPVEFPYVYLPDSARSMTWTTVRDPDARCGDVPYGVKVFDLNSRRGPNREVARVFTLPAASKSTAEILDVEALRGQVVTIQLAPLSATSGASCIGWSGLRLLGPRVDAERATGAPPDHG